eukprot:CAMPEP_0174257160 /NCGR_PEP_ID=MMETSP0439-20130205/6320_1 /TAXON_ID=0 /ORGANISM="Stereomyxa ramosa, Strain Chinc5" /LENGTH=137 /DNA_ID=CAMNT_0015340107 /DNA_START=30 /DNA_END=443 /DNA_ORIENTATION=+
MLRRSTPFLYSGLRSSFLRPQTICVVPFTRSFAGEVSQAGGKVAERGKILEDIQVQKHEQEILKKLREKLQLQDDEELHVDDIDHLDVRGNGNLYMDDDDIATHDDVDELRHEIVTKLRDLEDTIAAMKAQMKKTRK